MREITDILSMCPSCGCSWQGESFSHLYKEAAARYNVTLTTDELQQLTDRHLPATHQSVLINIHGTDQYMCPNCENTFILKKA